MQKSRESFEVIIVGAGHAGCEAALAAARMGHRTLLITQNLDTVALMPCNPSVGGPAKGHVVREIDALGGEMARNTDRYSIQIRMLNSGKGPAVQAPRAQCDKKLYALGMKTILETTPNLSLRQTSVTGLIMEPLTADTDTARLLESVQPTRGAAEAALSTPAKRLRIVGVATASGMVHRAASIILTTGTFLSGRIISGEISTEGGRAGEAAAYELSNFLGELQFPLVRLKTGTPPRIDARTIDFASTSLQPGSPTPLYFGADKLRSVSLTPLSSYPQPESNPRTEWRRQMACYLVHTNPDTHRIIRNNLDRSPMFNGTIEGVGPRYCPSIEDKVHRFEQKESHQLFLEPEGWRTNEVYVQGCSTSLPEDVQWSLIRTVPALRDAELMRPGYAVEYDAVPSSEITPWLETKRVAGLFLAGQINGTSGYEEAAGQGIMAGINAALYCRRNSGALSLASAVEVPRSVGEESHDAITSAIESVRAHEPLVLPRHLAYLGVMLDDLTARDHTEPYRLMTSRAEYRLLLRADNSDLRLSAIGYCLGLISEERYDALQKKQALIAQTLDKLAKGSITRQVAERLAANGFDRPEPGSHNMLEYVRRQETTYNAIGALLPGVNLTDPIEDEAAQQVEITAKYAGYIAKQQAEIAKMQRLETRRIPHEFRYNKLSGLKSEAREKLDRFLPTTVGQASRIAGVTPADIAVLLVHLTKHQADVK